MISSMIYCLSNGVLFYFKESFERKDIQLSALKALSGFLIFYYAGCLGIFMFFQGEKFVFPCLFVRFLVSLFSAERVFGYSLDALSAPKKWMIVSFAVRMVWTAFRLVLGFSGEAEDVYILPGCRGNNYAEKIIWK